MSDSYDFIVIGAGSAGYAGANTAARLGLKTLVVEGGREIGGLCILRGCMPSKTLLESAQRAFAIREAAEFGIKATYRGADGPAIRARKRRLIGEFADYRRGQLESGPFEFLRGRAAFVDARTIDVQLPDGGRRRIGGHSFLIATGSKIADSSIEGLDEVGYWTSDDVLDADTIPDSVCILGGGAIALEIASYYHGLGVPTTVLQRSSQVLKETDADVAEALTAAMRRRGIEILSGTTLGHASLRGTRKCVHFEHRGQQRTVEAGQIVCALGRRPALDDLALECAGVNVEEGRIACDPSQRCGAAPLFAAGDVCSPHEVVHIAIQQAELAARNAARALEKLGGAPEQIDYTLKLFACFTHPEIAAVGLTERECAEQNRDILVARYAFADHGKAMVRGATDGFVKLIADRATRRLIGGACVGVDASELIHEIVVALRFHATAHDLATTPHYHPTLSEIWMYPAEALAEM